MTTRTKQQRPLPAFEQMEDRLMFSVGGVPAPVGGAMGDGIPHKVAAQAISVPLDVDPTSGPDGPGAGIDTISRATATQAVQIGQGGADNVAATPKLNGNLTRVYGPPKKVVKQTRTFAGDGPQIAWDAGFDNENPGDLRHNLRNGEPGGDWRIREGFDPDAKGFFGVFNGPGDGDRGVKDLPDAGGFDFFGGLEPEGNDALAWLTEGPGAGGVDGLDPTNVVSYGSTFGPDSSSDRSAPVLPAGTPGYDPFCGDVVADITSAVRTLADKITGAVSGAVDAVRGAADSVTSATSGATNAVRGAADSATAATSGGTRGGGSGDGSSGSYDEFYDADGNLKLVPPPRSGSPVGTSNPMNDRGPWREATGEEMAAARKEAQNKVINPTGPDDQPPPESAMFKLSPQDLMQLRAQPHITPDQDGGGVLGGDANFEPQPQVDTLGGDGCDESTFGVHSAFAEAFMQYLIDVENPGGGAGGGAPR